MSKNNFVCKCVVCGKEDRFDGIKGAFMEGWFFGRNQMCYDCGKNQKEDKKVEASYQNYIDII